MKSQFKSINCKVELSGTDLPLGLCDMIVKTCISIYASYFCLLPWKE